ncbi:MAG: hypothetical protein RIR79_146 [Pseudomonadota bacterium]|jgi:CRISPR-associated protein (TIGR02584 family)
MPLKDFMHTQNSRPQRRILLCVSGMSPAVITETLYALVTQATPFMPDEVHVVTTALGKQKILAELLPPSTGQFHRLVQEFLPNHPIRFDAETVNVIQEAGIDLEDITTDTHNKSAANALYGVMRALKSVPSTVLHASVAGGRKSMSFYMGHAFSLLAEPLDTLSHVLVSAPFETVRGFYYPPKLPIELDFKGQTISTKDANIQLAELSVLKLGSILGKDWPTKAQTDFDFAIRLAQATFEPPQMVVKFDREKHKGLLEVCGETINLSPLEFAVFAVHALARKHEGDLVNGAKVNDLKNIDPAFAFFLEEQMNREFLHLKKKTESDHIYSKVHKKLHDIVGAVADHFTIDAIGERVKNQNRPTQLKAPANCLTLVAYGGAGVPPQGWQLKAPANCLTLVGLDHWYSRVQAVLGVKR